MFRKEASRLGGNRVDHDVSSIDFALVAVKLQVHANVFGIWFRSFQKIRIHKGVQAYCETNSAVSTRRPLRVRPGAREAARGIGVWQSA